MAAAQRGDRETYRRLLAELRNEIERIAKMRVDCADATDRVVEQVLTKIHRVRLAYQPGEPFGPWMRTIVRSEVALHLRSTREQWMRERSANSPVPIRASLTGADSKWGARLPGSRTDPHLAGSSRWPSRAP